MKKVLFSSIIFCCLLNQLSAQTNFTASAKKVVDQGERFRLNFTINAVGDNFIPPNLSDFHILAGPNPATSTSFQFINGQSSQSVSTTYSYVLQPKKEGQFTIGKAQITADGKTFSSAPISIEVIKGQASTNQKNENGESQSDVNSGDIFIQYLCDKTTVYQGEQFNVSLKIYDGIEPKTRGEGGLNGLNQYKAPSLTGFYSNILKDPTQNTSPDRETVNGKIYSTYKVWHAILYSQQVGDITIEPFELECVLRQKTKRRTFFGEIMEVYQNVSKLLKSQSRTIKVLPLPANAPASYAGAVGSNFRLDISLDKKDLKSNESLTMNVMLSGNGNLKIIDKLKIEFPSSFEVYDPKIHNDIKGTSGTNTYEYLIIPREPGEYVIPPIEFGYFDVNTKSYKTLSSEEFKFEIAKGNSIPNSVSGINKESVKQLGTDIRFIDQDNFELRKKNYSFFGSLAFSLFYIVSIVIFLILVYVLRERIKQNKNISLIKNRRANKISQKRLKAASVCMKNGEKQTFYDEVIKALWGYLSDKLNIPLANLSRETAREALSKRQIDELFINGLIEVIDNCEFAKYAPSAGHDQIEQDFDKAKNIINKLEQIL